LDDDHELFVVSNHKEDRETEDDGVDNFADHIGVSVGGS
jgi:hypothetical protein